MSGAGKSTLVRCINMLERPDEGAVLIDNVKVYSHVTEGGIYNLDGTPGPYLDAIRTLNANLPD